MACKMCTIIFMHVRKFPIDPHLTFMILLLVICPQSRKCKKVSDWLRKLVDAKTIFKNKVLRDWSIMNIWKTNHIY